jgi:LEA14-like dessication related protein
MAPALRLALLALAAPLVMIGCATSNPTAVPHVTLSDVRIAQIDFGGVDMKVELVVHNPGARDIKLDAYHWDMMIAGRRVAKGNSRTVQYVEPKSELQVPIDVTISNGDVYHILGTDHPVRPPEFDFGISSLITGGLFNDRGNFQKRGQLPLLYKPAIRLQNLRIMKMTEHQATVKFDAVLENNNAFAIHLDKMKASLNLAGRPVAQDFESSAKDIAPGASVTADYELDLDLDLLGRTVASALRERDVSYEFSGTTAFDTPWGRKGLNFSQSGRIVIQR